MHHRHYLAIIGAITSLIYWGSEYVLAHGGGSLSGGEIPATVIIIGVWVIGTVTGLTSVLGFGAIGDGYSTQITVGTGVIICLLGLSMLYSVASEAPFIALGGLSIGFVIGGLSIRRHHPTVSRPQAVADTMTGALFVHRFIEGFVLGTLVITEHQLVPLSVLGLGGHVVMEMILLGSVYHRATLLSRGVIAVVLIQGGFISASLLGAWLSQSFLPEMRISLIGGVGGLLTILGGYESLAHTDSWDYFGG